MLKKNISPKIIQKVLKFIYKKYLNSVVHELLHLFLSILPPFMCFQI
jgi:hypothetical protein